jgi:serine/threonine protein kinase
MNSIQFTNCKYYHPINDYLIGQNLGSGSFSVVKKCFDRQTNELFAMKIIKKKSFKKLEILENEVTIIQQTSHPNIIKLIDLYETEEELFLVMEFIQGGELYESLINNGPFTEEEAYLIFRKIIEAVQYLHSNGITHRDIKLENILWTESKNELKLTDFSLSKNLQLSDIEFMRTPCGTPSYVAPEIIKGEPYTRSVDLWALGVVLYLLLFCKYPFSGDCDAEIYQQIENGTFIFPSEIEISEEVMDLISNLLKGDSKRRFTLEQVISHPWMQKHWGKSG